ncbi:MAG: type II toxin-antitoxin system RelE/ParE family toxin [Deltaproteobacteria bacterium]|nr:type II toxin-antitoxin system RelE/ParE family toxin [Deltaproteobacteria bacterium]
MLRLERGVLLHRYKIFETERFSQDPMLIAKGGRRQLMEKLCDHVYPQLKNEPHFGPNIKRLRGWSPPTWRFRIGDWRFFYILDEELKAVYMLAASHRKEAYR